MSELSALRENMPTNKTPARAVRGRAATTAFLAERGFTGDVARRISTLMHDKRVSAQASTDTERFREALSTFLRVAPFPVPAEGRQVITLVGRTGVGKTTTAAKLAARAVFDHEQTVTLIAADTQRVGASYQLKRFATLIGAEFAAVGPEQSLTELVQACTSDLVIVDTSGSSSPEELAGLAANVTNRAAWVLACIPAGVSELETEATITRLGGLRPTGLIITKLDECHRPTALAAAPAISGLPVHAITNGPRVPEGIAPATMSGLLDALSGPTAPSASRPRTARAA
jgi:flagellar biosynthesis protein FlhF